MPGDRCVGQPGTEKTTAHLMPRDANALLSSGEFKAVPGNKAIVKFTLPGKTEEQVRLAFR